MISMGRCGGVLPESAMGQFREEGQLMKTHLKLSREKEELSGRGRKGNCLGIRGPGQVSVCALEEWVPVP